MDACSHCGVGGCALFRCAGCRTEVYCSAACQRAAYAVHRGFCKGVRAQRRWPSVTGLDCCAYCRAVARPPAARLPAAACYLADYFYKGTVLSDVYPPADAERIYGIEMGTWHGAVMLACWQRLMCMHSIFTAGEHPSPYACPAAVAAALAAGTLPALYERAVRGLAAFSRGDFPVLDRMVEVGFGDIPWDERMLRGLPRVCLEDEAVPAPSSWVFADVSTSARTGQRAAAAAREPNA